MERVNREIRKKTRVAVLFPNTKPALRLVSGVLIEIHEEWINGRPYLEMSEFHESSETNLVSFKKLALSR